MSIEASNQEYIEKGWKITIKKQPTFAQALILAYEWLMIAKLNPPKFQEIET